MIDVCLYLSDNLRDQVAKVKVKEQPTSAERAKGKGSAAAAERAANGWSQSHA